MSKTLLSIDVSMKKAIAYQTKFHNFKLNSWSYDYPRFTKAFYFGRASQRMVFLLMFDKMHTEEDEIRFSLFKFKLNRVPRPAWDFDPEAVSFHAKIYQAQMDILYAGAATRPDRETSPTR